MDTPCYAEVIYETGSKSVVLVENMQEFEEGIRIQHNRAKSGEAGGPAGHPAERVTKILLYSEHPANYNEGQLVSTETVGDIVDAVAMGGEVSIEQLRNQLVVEASPIKSNEEITSPHDSMYRMDHDEEHSLAFLESGN